MKFEKAFDLVFEAHEKRELLMNKKFGVSPATAKTLAYLWNMLAVAQNVLDDTVYIDDNNAIVSTPLKTQKSEKKNKKGAVDTPPVEDDGKSDEVQVSGDGEKTEEAPAAEDPTEE